MGFGDGVGGGGWGGWEGREISKDGEWSALRAVAHVDGLSGPRAGRTPGGHKPGAARLQKCRMKHGIY